MVENHKNTAWVYLILILLAFAGIYYLFIKQDINANVIQEHQSKISQDVIEKNIEIVTCIYDIQSYLNTEDYSSASQSIDSCRRKINQARAEIEQLSRFENDITIIREYEAMLTDYKGSVIDLDFSKINLDIIEGGLSQEEINNKMEISIDLLEQYLKIRENLEDEYSDTYYFQSNYGTGKGQELFIESKETYQELLVLYKNRTSSS